MDHSIDSGNMHGLTVYVKEVLPFAISRKLSRFLFMFSTGFTSFNMFVFGDFNVHHKDWLTYSGGTDRPGKLCYNFPISNDLARMVNFPTQMPG